MSELRGYSARQIRLHWIVAVLIVLQFVLHEPIAEAWEVVEEGGAPTYSWLIISHILGGGLILLFAMWRLALRQTRGVPPPPAEEPEPLRMAAHIGHLALYALMILMPISGVVAWFGGVEAAAEAHETMKVAMLLLVAVHVVAALWHQFWLKDGLLLRMKKPLD